MRDKLHELDLGLLQTLEALLRTRSVTAAAEELDVSQSAVSHALARLRDLFDDPLLVRSGRAMIATPRGLELADPVARILLLGQQVLAPAMGFDPGAAKRTITLCLDDMGELAVLPHLMSELRAAAPHCALETLSAEGAGFEPILNGARVDLGIAGPLAPGADVLHQKLYRHTFTVIASQDCGIEGTIEAAQYLALAQKMHEGARKMREQEPLL